MMIGKDPPEITSGISWLPRGGLMKILGIYFSSDKSPNALENNWNDKIEKNHQNYKDLGEKKPFING